MRWAPMKKVGEEDSRSVRQSERSARELLKRLSCRVPLHDRKLEDEEVDCWRKMRLYNSCRGSGNRLELI